jgi:hypothetical protein
VWERLSNADNSEFLQIMISLGERAAAQLKLAA